MNGKAYFDLETIALLREILEDAWALLRPEQRATMLKTTLAERILKSAAQGERDRDRLLDAALMELPAVGTVSWSSSKRFGATSTFNVTAPVTLPPGRFRLATRPSSTGSLLVVKTMGIFEVAAFAMRLAGVLVAAITATPRLTRSAASAGSLSYWPSAHRYSIATLRFST